jgi:Lipoprotein LpqB beta-propeller domain/Sporulation and spore germination
MHLKRVFCKALLTPAPDRKTDYSVAREYLTEELAARWKPNNQVLVEASRPKITMISSNRASVLVPLVATVDERGLYEVARPGAAELLNFTFVKEAGQWRIAEAPDLTMVIRPVFDVIFEAYSIYFYDNQSKYLVPDVRWFPSRVSTSTRLISALLNGPSKWLANTVNSAIPQGTTLNLNTVAIAEGVAAVDLSRKALTATAFQKKLLQAQITKSLMQLPSVYSVQVSIERGLLDTYNLSNEFSRVLTPVAMFKDDLVHMDSGNQTPIPGAKLALKNLGATEFGLNAEESLAAFTTEQGIYLANLTKPGDEPKLLSTRTDFLAPVIDKQGNTWLVSNNGGSTLVFDAAGTRLNFDARWLQAQKVLSFSISDEGSRIAAIVDEGKNTKLLVSAIVRLDSGWPRYLDLPIAPNAATKLFSVDWLDETHLGLLEKQDTNFVQPWVTLVGGATASLPTISNAETIVGAGQSSTIYALDIFGSMHLYRGNTWIRVADAIVALH